jgi:hypothetical protein
VLSGHEFAVECERKAKARYVGRELIGAFQCSDTAIRA